MAPLKTLLAPLALAGALFSSVAFANGAKPKSKQVIGIPIANADTASDLLVPDAYIVVYNTSFAAADIEATQTRITSVIKKRNIGKRSLDGRQLSTEVHNYNINGWRVSAMEADPRTIMSVYNEEAVSYVEQDVYTQLNYVIEKTVPVQKRAPASQNQATTGLSRISKAAVGGANSYTFDDSAGEGITIYVVDTGVMTTHQDFGGRATMGFSSIANEEDTDLNGHGSHVAGTCAGSTFGVAKKADIIGVKVLNADGAGRNSFVLDGMQFVADDARANNRSGKAVMNMSLGGPTSGAVNTAINRVRAAGVLPVVAAGNENADTATTSPGSAPGAYTVGAIDQTTDAKASFSNFGPLVDIYAPGVRVTSVGIQSNTAQSTLSGTSMASPHVAGVAAYLMAKPGENLNGIDAVATRMTELANATNASVKNNVRGTTSLILNNGEL